MTSKKTLSEKILEIQNRKEQLENQIKQLVQKQKEEDRKARTRRLIERGALLESFIDGAEALTHEQVKEILTTALASSHRAESNPMREYRRAKRAMEPVTEDAMPRRTEPDKQAAEEAPIRRREPPRAPEELRRPWA